MINIENKQLLGAIIAEEIKIVQTNPRLTTAEIVRFTNALAKAATRVEEDGVFMDWDADDERLLIWSRSNKIYEMRDNKRCQCEAGQLGIVCWHRAAYRLVAQYTLALSLEGIDAAMIELTVGGK